MDRWMRGSTGRSDLLRLPAVLLLHSVLPFLDFEHLLIHARRVSQAIKGIAERAACTWMNQRFPVTVTNRSVIHADNDALRRRCLADLHQSDAVAITSDKTGRHGKEKVYGSIP